MSSSSENVVVNICGIEFSIKTEIDIVTTKKIAEFVNQKMMELKKNSSIRDDIKIAVLSALNIAGELYEYKEKWNSIQKEIGDIENRVGRLGKKIDSCIT